jgi:hypothetical protein
MLDPWLVPVTSTQTPLFRFERLPGSCAVVVVLELSSTVARPVGLSDVVSVKDEPLTAVTGPTTGVEIPVAAAATVQKTVAATPPPNNPPAPIR